MDASKKHHKTNEQIDENIWLNETKPMWKEESLDPIQYGKPIK